MRLRTLHRLIGIALGVFWAFQALTGVLLVFRWELDDALLEGPAKALDVQGLQDRVSSIGAAKGSVSSVWTSGSAANRFDIYYADVRGVDRTMRVDGAGNTLRDEPDGMLSSAGGFFNALTTMHTSLFGGRSGELIVAGSGVVLLANLFAGLRLAWPRAQRWRDVLFVSGRHVADSLRWHRSIGLWTILPLAVLVTCGIALAFRSELEHWLGTELVEPTTMNVSAEDSRRVGLAAVLTTAFAAHEDAALTALVLPQRDAPWYRVRLRGPEERARIWGTTTVLIDATTGQVVGDHPASSASRGRWFIDLLYPLHTGQQGGAPLRSAVLLIGCLLMAIITIGLRRAWVKRRPGSGASC